MKYIIDIPDGMTCINALKYEDSKCVAARSYIIPDLTPYTEPDRKAVDLQYAHDIENVARMNYNEGAKDAWEFVGIICDMTRDERKECFGGSTCDLDEYMTYQEAKSKYEAWKESKEEIRVGDEVTDNDLGDIGVVTYVNDSCYCILWSSGVVSEDVRKSKLRRTGRHFNITHELLKKMKEGDRP